MEDKQEEQIFSKVVDACIPEDFEFDKEGQEEGYLKILFATIGTVDKVGDVYLPNSVQSKSKVPLAQYNHSSELPIGVGKVSVEGTNVYWEGKIDLEHPEGMNTYRHIKEMGKSQEYSFRYVANYKDMKLNDHGGYDFKKLNVFETSPVLRGAGNQTQTILLKSQQENEVEKNMENEQLLQQMEEMKSQLDAINAEKAEKEAAEKDAVEQAKAEEVSNMKNEMEDIKSQMDEMKKTFAKPKAQDYNEKKDAATFAKNLLVDSGILKEFMDGKKTVSKEVGGLDFEGIKATLLNYGTVTDTVRPTPTLVQPYTALDMMQMVPTSGNSVSPRPVSVGGNQPAGREPDTSLEGDLAAAPPRDYPVRTVRATYPVSNDTVDDGGPEFMAVAQQMLREALRVSMNNANFLGDGSSPNLFGFTNLTANPIGSNTDILNGAKGLNKLIPIKHGIGSMPTMIVMTPTDAEKVYSSLQALGFATREFIGFPYGGVLGVPVVLHNGLAANTAYIVNTSFNSHYLAIKRDMRVEMSVDEEFSQDNVVFKVSIRYANVIVQDAAHEKLTTTNNWS